MDWFSTWFNSPYYHLLYRNRNEAEAESFIDHLLAALQPPAGAHLLDLACGKGRHARYLADKGDYDVTGVNLSTESIAYAEQFAHERLHFWVRDMRHPFCHGCFDYVFNFFTSFGYFASIEENAQTLRAIHTALQPNGILVIDFLNIEQVAANLVASEQKVIDGVVFDIRKSIADGFINKQITVQDAGNTFHFTERVQALSEADFRRHLADTGFSILHLWGDYELNPFHAPTSNRFIVVAQKNA